MILYKMEIEQMGQKLDGDSPLAHDFNRPVSPVRWWFLTWLVDVVVQS